MDCPKCGAPLHPEPHAEYVHCSYCQEDMPNPGYRPPRSEKKPHRHHEEKEEEKPAATADPPKFNFVPIAVGAVVAIVLAVVYVEWRGKGTGANDPPILTTAAHEEVEWDSANDPPTMIDIGGREDFIGPFWKPGRGNTRASHDMFIGVFDGASHTEKWSVGPVGKSGAGKGAVHVGAANGRIVMTDPMGVARVYDAAASKQLAAITLADRARRVCTSGNQAWVEVLGDKSVMIDLGSNKSSPAPRPQWCPDRSAQTATECASHRGRSLCLAATTAPSAPNFTANRVLVDGGDAVAIGVGLDSMIVGFDPKTRAVRWTSSLPSSASTKPLQIASSVAEIAQGVLLAQYEEKSTKWRLAAFDVKTGARKWDVEVPGTKHGDEARSLVTSRTRAYLSHGDWLDIFDLQTGTAIGEFGR